MHNLSMMQALGVWSELEAALYGQNGYGSDTAEVYAYRLMQQSPMRDEGMKRLQADEHDDSIFAKDTREMLKQAVTSLRALILLFEEAHEVRVMVVGEGRKDAARASEWLTDHVFGHRIHLRVAREKP